ncbi:MAG: MFS transporter, partial [Haloferacaceae archaeon]
LWFVVAAAAPVLNLIAIEGVPESRWGERVGLLNVYQGYGWVGGLLLGTAWTIAAPRLPGGDPGLRPLFPLLAGVAGLGFALVRVQYPERPTTDPARFRRAFRRMGGGLGAGRYLRSVPYGPGRIYWAIVSARRGPREYLSRFRPELRRYLLGSTLFATGFAVFWGPMPAFLRGVPLATGPVFVLFLVANLGSAVCYGPVGERSGEETSGPLQRVALAGRGVLFAAVPVVAGLPRGLSVGLLGVAFALVGVTWAVIAVTTPGLVGRLAAADVRAEALGVQAALAGVGTGVGSVAGGAAATLVGYGPTFVAAAALVLVGGALALGID